MWSSYFDQDILVLIIEVMEKEISDANVNYFFPLYYVNFSYILFEKNFSGSFSWDFK